MHSLGGRHQQALETVEKALAIWPDNIRLLVWGANIAARAGAPAIQRRYLDRAVKLDPDDAALRRLSDQAKAATA